MPGIGLLEQATAIQAASADCRGLGGAAVESDKVGLEAARLLATSPSVMSPFCSFVNRVGLSLRGSFAATQEVTACHLQAAARPGGLFVAVAIAICLTGCGTTKWTDSARSATEQLLTSDAIERAVMQVDATPLAGRKAFLDVSPLDKTNDSSYLQSSLRHQLLACGVGLAESKADAEVVVEARAGAIGTNRDELMVGLPQTNLTVAGFGGMLPEMSLAKRTDQEAVAKLSLFAYDRETGMPVWQSGVQNVASRTHDRWYFGAGPFKTGDVTESPRFAGIRLRMPTFRRQEPAELADAVKLTKPHLYDTLPPLPEDISPVLTAAGDADGTRK